MDILEIKQRVIGGEYFSAYFNSNAKVEQFMYLGLTKIPIGPLYIKKRLSHLMYHLLWALWAQ